MPCTQDPRRTGVSGDGREVKLYGQLIGGYRNEKDRFGGTFYQDWSQTISDYESHAEIFNLKKNKSPVLSVIFIEDARNLYENEVKTLHTWGEAMMILKERYNSEAKSVR